mmetsp:Transcript_29115/g.46354  ORF Transcript_29115/g.46354 Transcript_29115/m.46354 type:complete len:370 (-) Transcript_29115:12-1121(-)
MIHESQSAACRVCHCTADEEGELVSPCLCDGSVKWVHRRCLNHWRLQGSERKGRATRCELCGFTYVYATKKTSRSRAVLATCIQGALASIPFAASAGLLAYVVSPQAGALATGGVLSLWAIADLSFSWALPFGNVACATLSKLRVAMDLSRDEAEAQADALVQAKAIHKSESAAAALSRIRSAPAGVELSERESTSFRVDDDAEVLESSADAPDLDATAETQDLADSQIQRMDSESLELELRELWLHQATSPSVALRTELRHRRTCPVGCRRFTSFLLLSLVGLGVGICKLSSRSHTESELPNLIVKLILWTVAISGASYWLLIFVLLLVLSMLEPAPRDLVRGMDGFYLVRSLDEQERIRLASTTREP